MTDALTHGIVRLQNAYADLREREEGQALVEYALIIAFIALVAVGALTFLGGKVTSLFDSIGSTLP